MTKKIMTKTTITRVKINDPVRNRYFIGQLVSPRKKEILLAKNYGFLFISVELKNVYEISYKEKEKIVTKREKNLRLAVAPNLIMFISEKIFNPLVENQG